MGRLTIRLPETLHDHLGALAEGEEVSLNRYLVYALTRQVTLACTVQAVPERAVAEQQASYTALLQSLGQASFDEIEAVIAGREAVEPEAGLSPEVRCACGSDWRGDVPRWGSASPPEQTLPGALVDSYPVRANHWYGCCRVPWRANPPAGLWWIPALC